MPPDQVKELIRPIPASPACRGSWHLLVGNAGFPNAGTFPGTDLLWANCEESGGDGTTVIGIPHGGLPGGGDTQHILNVGVSLGPRPTHRPVRHRPWL